MTTLGYRHSPEARKKIGDFSRGKKCLDGCVCWKHSEETRKRQSSSASGRTMSEESRKKIAQANKGKKCPSGCSCKRHVVSEETRQKMTENRKGRTPQQEERRLKALREKVIGNKWAEGTVFSDEERSRRSKLSKGMWADGVFDGASRPYFGKSAGEHAGIRMRCLNSEGVFARDLDRAGITWEYEPQRFKLSWCNYTPDFYLPEFDIWIEVKGYPKQVGNWAKKIETFRAETGKTLILVFQKELSSCKYGGE